MFILVQPKARKRYVLWLKLCGVSLAVHLVLLFLLFFVYHRDELHMVLTMAHSNGAPVIMIPRKPGGRPGMVHAAGTNKKAGAKQSSAAVMAKPASKKAASKKPMPAKASLLAEQTKKVDAKKQKKKPEKSKKERVCEQPKKDVEKKDKQKKLPKESLDTKPREEKKLEEKKIEEAVAQDKKVDTSVQEDSGAADDMSSIELPLSGTISMHDFHMQQKCIELQQALSQHWQPPLGAADCVCRISAAIDATGQVSELVMQQESGVLIYDVAARTALYEAELPRWLWGKTITITFEQA